MDSDEFVGPTLADKFELRESGLNDIGVTEFIAHTLQDMPADEVRVVSLIGGAASGKSTIARQVINALAKSGVGADVIGTDDFNKGDRTWRWKNFEGKDGADPIGKYDFNLLNAKIKAIKANRNSSETVPVPTYNQETGLAVDEGEENYAHCVGNVGVLIVEGDFHAVERPDLVVYMHVPDEQRLQNRINRDVQNRGGEVDKTTASFNFRHKVQHLPHTLPTIEKADYVIDVDTSRGDWQFDIYQARPSSS